MEHRVKIQRSGDGPGEVGISKQRKRHSRNKLSRMKVILNGNLHSLIFQEMGSYTD